MRASIKSAAANTLVGITAMAALISLIRPGFLVRLLAAISPGFRDLLYQESAKGLVAVDWLVTSTIIVLSLIAIGYPTLWALDYVKIEQPSAETARELRRRPRLNLLSVGLILYCLIINSWASTVSAVAFYALESIEILANTVPYQTRCDLEEALASVGDADSFYAFRTKVEVLAQSNNQRLPEFDPL